MRKVYVLDTNVLLHDPSSLMHFEDNTVVIPIDVIQEIDRFKREQSERGHHAREVSRLLDSLRDGSSLADGIRLDNGTELRVYWDPNDPNDPREIEADSHILKVAQKIQRQGPGVPVVIVSKDINLRIRADAMGLRAEDYESDRVILADLYSGQAELELAPDEVQALRIERHWPLPEESPLSPNQYALVKPSDGSRGTVLARRVGSSGSLQAIASFDGGICGIAPRNKEQFYAMDALLDDRIKLATIMGKAGTGKTLLAVACGLHQTLIKKTYKGVLIARPTVSVGRELGHLPGDIARKMEPWMRPVVDTVEFLFDAAQSIGGRTDASALWKSGIVEIQPLSFIRGRSISSRFVIVDEAQNLSPLEVKTIITRVGHASKVVLTGDPYQIDNPYVDSSSNGFNYLVNRFRSEPIAAHVELYKGERSELAELAANLL
jgi:PhoH-like ATPase